MFDGIHPDDKGPLAHDTQAEPGKFRYRAIWISDIHLGTVGCQADLLLEFLKHTESKYLYLVGDIIDGWALKRRWYWHQRHNDVVQKVLRKARKGTHVTYIAGNHDEGARQFLGLGFGGIVLADEVVPICHLMMASGSLDKFEIGQKQLFEDETLALARRYSHYWPAHPASARVLP